MNKISGVGLGIRGPHISQILEENPKLPWLELLADNYIREGGEDLLFLDKIREFYPMTFHCVGMNLGGTDPLDFDYLGKIKKLSKRYRPLWISDHISWCVHGGRYHHDLLPLPYTKESVENMAGRIVKVQEFLGERILIENASTYIKLKDSEMEEWEFLSEVSKRASCDILLDINNIHVNSVNHGFDPIHFLRKVPKEKVKEFHLAGYEQDENILIDTHGSPVSNKVWELFDDALKFFGPIPTLIERDNNIPSLNELIKEVAFAQEKVQLWS